jgi:hypothetical protein
MRVISYSNDPYLENGYYLYNNTIHTDRHTIAEDIVSDYNNMKNYDNNLSFYFHDKHFSSFNWTKEPNESLKTLYKQRAIQLRDSYKYLILSYSGGSDSHEVLETFLENNIFIDEIYISNWEKLLNKIDRNELLQDEHLKFFMEYELNVIPMMKKIKEKSPNTKISIIDSSDFLHNDILSGNFDILGMRNTNGGALRGLMVPIPMTIKIFSGHNIARIAKKDTAFIVGIEKPRILLIDNKIYFCFSDAGYTYDKLINNKLIDKMCKIEYFYWSPNASYIPIKQAHIIKKELETDYNFYNQYINTETKAIQHDTHKKIGHNQWYDFERILMTKIYSNLDSLNYFPGKPKIISPELKLLVKYHGLGTKITGSYKEAYSYRSKKYHVLKGNLLKRTIITKKYFIGIFEPKWLRG